ncbi:hypothetical protein BUE80_DR007318 [Diplocarpon rosae]|nr:hypothetical protein BUE80_DR007318 [Diplocarpon rosae]
METWQYRDNYSNYSYSNFFIETFYSIAKDNFPLIKTYISGSCYLAYRFQGFLPDLRAIALCRFKISLKDNYKFNYSIIINIIYIDSDFILHIIYSAISYSIRGFLKNMIGVNKYIILKIAFKAINNTIGPGGIVLILLVYSIYLRLLDYNALSLSVTKRHNAL